MDRIADLVRQLQPDAPPPPEGAEARQRDALLRSIAHANQARPDPGRRRLRRRRWVVAIAAGAAAAALAAALVPGPASPPRPPAARSPVLTAITKALAATGEDIEQVRSTTMSAVVQLSTTSWVDLATGACRADVTIDGKPSVTVFVEHGKAVFIDHADRDWWTRASGGVTCEPLTPAVIEHDVSEGRYSVAGHAILDGQQTLKLVSAATTTSGPHPVAQFSNLWVNASTYLPIQSTSIESHLSEQTAFTWLPATHGNARILEVAVPAGFRHVAARRAQSGIVFGP